MRVNLINKWRTNLILTKSTKFTRDCKNNSFQRRGEGDIKIWKFSKWWTQICFFNLKLFNFYFYNFFKTKWIDSINAFCMARFFWEGGGGLWPPLCIFVNLMKDGFYPNKLTKFIWDCKNKQFPIIIISTFIQKPWICVYFMTLSLAFSKVSLALRF